MLNDGDSGDTNTATTGASSGATWPSNHTTGPPGTTATEPGSVCSTSAARTTVMEPGGLDWNGNGLITTDTEYPATSPHPQPLSYAHVTRSQRHPTHHALHHHRQHRPRQNHLNLLRQHDITGRKY